MRALFHTILFIAISIVSFTSTAHAALETNILITVKARDAKFIGSEAGGAFVTIRNRLTGEIIADGMTYGTTGDTDLLMADSIARDAVLVTEDSAFFQFSLDFWEPIPVTITATGPMGQTQSTVSVSEDMLLLPGKDYTSGNGIMLELPGFAVDVVSPLPNAKYEFNPDIPVTLEANVMKMCGCKIEPGTPWSPERYLVEVHIYKASFYITSFTVPYSGEPGIYTHNLKLPKPGTYKMVVTAFDQKTKEAGMDTTTVILTKPEQQ